MVPKPGGDCRAEKKVSQIISSIFINTPVIKLLFFIHETQISCSFFVVVVFPSSAADESQVNLAIVQASSKDSGVYRCTISNEYGTDTTDFQLSTDGTSFSLFYIQW